MFLRRINERVNFNVLKWSKTSELKSNFLHTSYSKIFCEKISETKDFQEQSEEKLKENIEEPKIEDPIEEVVYDLSNIYDIGSKKMGPKDPSKFIDISRFKHNNVKLRVFVQEEFFKSEPKQLTPVVPRLGPFEIVNPQLEGKTYHWCACGMSNKQPFCDGSHKNGKIRPISFKLGEKVDSMFLCGCKLSSLKPFCDKKTCVELQKKEKEDLERYLSK